MNYLIFGGSGFIGTHLIHLLREECAGPGDKIYDLDIVMPGEEGVVPGAVEKNEGVEYVRVDVRKPIALAFQPTGDDVIFNLAAVHRTPGHEDRAYFETNIRGAENVTEFAERHGIRKILFASSIAPYGAAEELKEEPTLPMPDTPYGISKLVAEKIHEKWQNGDAAARELDIFRPGVVYGKGEHGNFTRLYQGLRGRYFFYAGRRDTVKACIYVKDLVGFMAYLLRRGRAGVHLYNCTIEPALRIDQICEAMMEAGGFRRQIPLVPAWILLGVAGVLGPLGGKKFGIHPDRVRKLMVSTNISGKKMAGSGYQFRYSFGQSLGDWMREEGWARGKGTARAGSAGRQPARAGGPTIRVVVAAHKDYWMPPDGAYLPLEVGRAGRAAPAIPGIAGDDTGENISVKNPNYCELTGLYWAWKNLDADYIGLAHYRRHFASPAPRLRKKDRVASEAELRKAIFGANVLLPKPRHYLIETNYSQYAHAHHAADLDAARAVLVERFPRYVRSYDKVMGRTSGHRFNMLVMERDALGRYCKWLFAVLSALEERLDISGYGPNDSRVFGFVGERLLDVWLDANKVSYKELPYVFLERQNWLNKGARFLGRKLKASAMGEPAPGRGGNPPTR